MERCAFLYMLYLANVPARAVLMFMFWVMCFMSTWSAILISHTFHCMLIHVRVARLSYCVYIVTLSTLLLYVLIVLIHTGCVRPRHCFTQEVALALQHCRLRPPLCKFIFLGALGNGDLFLAIPYLKMGWECKSTPKCLRST